MDEKSIDQTAELTGWPKPLTRLREALEKDEFTLYCQPVVALRGGERFPIAEVLVRMREEAQALRHAIEIDVRAGDLAEARRKLAIAIPLGLFPGVPSDVMLSLHASATLVAAQTGDLDEARAALEAAEAHRDGAIASEIKLAYTAGYAALVEGDSKAAAAHLRAARTHALAWGLAHPGVIPYQADLIEALVGIGSLDEADALTTELLELGERLDNARALATGMRARGLVLGARGSTDEALIAFEIALDHHARLPAPVEHARTLLAQGTQLRRMKQKRAARDALTAALEIFDQSGARGWSRHAADQLSRISGRTAAATEELTETEAQIAALVADGLSNSEIAQKLFVSVRTVESNLTRIYRKLGVRGRTELTRRTLTDQ